MVQPESFNLPQYREIPNVGLYLEQVTKYIAEFIDPLDASLTGSMVSNYVKKGIVANPVKKQYCRDQIAYLLFIAVTKSVLSLEDIELLIHLQEQSHSVEEAYGYFRTELLAGLSRVFGDKGDPAAPAAEEHAVRALLHSTVVAVAYKAFLDYHFEQIRAR